MNLLIYLYRLNSKTSSSYFNLKYIEFNHTGIAIDLESVVVFEGLEVVVAVSNCY